MKALIDIDSLIYKAVYRIINISEAKALIAAHGKEQAKKELIEKCLDRLNNMLMNILNDIEDASVPIDSYAIYVTKCVKSVRKSICTTYKSNRKRNKWVNAIRNEIVERWGAIYSDEWEADDLIANDANEDTIIISMDKDMKQIMGWHYDFYRNKETGLNRGLSFVDKNTAEINLAIQLLMGDSSDNIGGIKGIGIKTAKKIIGGKNGYSLFRAVVYEYIKRDSLYRDGWRLELLKNYRLVRIGFNVN